MIFTGVPSPFLLPRPCNGRTRPARPGSRPSSLTRTRSPKFTSEAKRDSSQLPSEIPTLFADHRGRPRAGSIRENAARRFFLLTPPTTRIAHRSDSDDGLKASAKFSFATPARAVISVVVAMHFEQQLRPATLRSRRTWPSLAWFPMLHPALERHCMPFLSAANIARIIPIIGSG